MFLSLVSQGQRKFQDCFNERTKKKDKVDFRMALLRMALPSQWLSVHKGVPSVHSCEDTSSKLMILVYGEEFTRRVFLSSKVYIYTATYIFWN